MNIVLTYEGYQLVEWSKGGYRSAFGDKVLNFDTATQWKQYIDLLKNGKIEKKSCGAI